MMSLLSGVRKVSNRLGLPWYHAIPVESFVRLYRHSACRAMLHPLFPARKPRGMLFVVGCYNTGTTVVKEAIALHPQVSIASIEGIRLSDTLPDLEDGGWPRCLYGNRAEALRERRHGEIDGERLLSDLRPWIEKGRYFLEKSVANTVRIPLLRRAFSGTRFVCVVREPDAVIRGIQRRSRPQGLARCILGSDAYPYAFLARQWRFFYSLVLEDIDPEADDIRLCSYERFIADPVGELTRLFAFLGLPAQTIALEGECLSVGSRSLVIRGAGTPHREGCLDDPTRLHAACIEARP